LTGHTTKAHTDVKAGGKCFLGRGVPKNAAFAYTYAQSNSLIVAGIIVPLTSTYPYRDDSFGLIIGSVALFVVGFALMFYRLQDNSTA